MEWTKKAVTKRMAEANKKGFIAISDGMYRNDDVFFIAMPTFRYALTEASTLIKGNVLV